VTSWAVEGIELPFGDQVRAWWIDQWGSWREQPVPGADALPGGFVLSGLVDAHSHPTVRGSPSGPVALDLDEARANLIGWAETGVTLIRDVGSPRGLTLTLPAEPGLPAVRAAGRFLAPAGRYFPELLGEPVGEADLVNAALAEVRRGATWVKVIADFPRVPEFTDVAPTYPVQLIAQMCEAVHQAGARVAAHATLPDLAGLIAAGVDSIEHGPGLDEETVSVMGKRGVAWTPTLCALLGAADTTDASPEDRERTWELRSRLAELLPRAVRAGVPVLAGTDVVGSIPQEVALLADMGLEPSQALAAASVWPRRFLIPDQDRPDVVTYYHDPREDPSELRRPAAVVIAGRRVR
jgi:imidazolonepropionase-like amidohydrolase